MPHSVWRIVVGLVLLSIPFLILLGVFLLLVCVILGADVRDVIGPAALVGLLPFPFAVVLALLQGATFRLNRLVVSVRDGLLTLDVGRRVESVPLAQCEWYIGRTWHMNYPEVMNASAKVLFMPAVVIALPWAARPFGYTRLVATGFTPQTRTQWGSFLTLAGVPRRTPWERTPQRMKAVMRLLGASALLVATFVVSSANLDHDIVRAGGRTICILGLFTLSVYATCFTPWTGARCVPTRWSAKEQTQMRLIWLLASLFIGAAVGVSSTFAPGPSVQSKATLLLVLLAWGWFFGRDFGWRLSAFEWELSRPNDRTDQKEDSVETLSN
ncbi:MAG: hypothetical protein HQ582_14955 [Planctomycetes bacterium]|nr:hypothetical protein [Planctomycetota bacterium]